MADCLGEINDCEYLFLTDIRHPNYHALRLEVEEGRPLPGLTSIEIAGAVISDCTRIDITDESRAFELVWDSYVSYCVHNESYASPPNSEETFTGRVLRLFSKSAFLDYLARATIADSDYPGPMQHYECVCQDHVVDVVSTVPPLIRRLR